MGKILALDVGGRRIGVAESDELLRIAYPLTTVIADGSEIKQIAALIATAQPVRIVVGFPRNQAGEPTAQTGTVEAFAKQLETFTVPITFQDESLTSVLAEQRLKEQGKPYTKEMIDAEAATIILQDYLESQHGH